MEGWAEEGSLHRILAPGRAELKIPAFVRVSQVLIAFILMNLPLARVMIRLRRFFMLHYSYAAPVLFRRVEWNFQS